MKPIPPSENTSESELLAEKAEIDLLERELSRLDFSAESRIKQNLYHRLKQRAVRHLNYQPWYMKLWPRLSTVLVLAVLLGSMIGVLRMKTDSYPLISVTALAAPNISPVATPAKISGSNVDFVIPQPVPTPKASIVSVNEAQTIFEKGTSLP